MKPVEMLEQGRFLGEEFLLWLWMQGLAQGGASGGDGDGSACFLDDSIQLASERGEVKNIALTKGNPAESREAFEALARGMRPVRAKVRVLSGDMEWVFTLTAADLITSGVKLPASTGKAPHERLNDRLFLVEEILGHLDRRFAAFLQARYLDPDAMTSELRAWIQAGLGPAAEPSVPWEEISPAHSAKALEVSKELLATHRTVQKLHPTTWREDLLPYMEAVKECGRLKRVSILEAGRICAEEVLARGSNPMMTLAATVELINGKELAHG